MMWKPSLPMAESLPEPRGQASRPHLPAFSLTVPADGHRYARSLFHFLLDRAAESE
jgi:hypothetical protein